MVAGVSTFFSSVDFVMAGLVTGFVFSLGAVEDCLVSASFSAGFLETAGFFTSSFGAASGFLSFATDTLASAGLSAGFY